MDRTIIFRRDGLTAEELDVLADRLTRPRPDMAVSYDDLAAMEHDDIAGSALDFAIVAVLCLCAAFAIWVATVIVESEIETLAPTAAEVMAADFDLERKLAEAE